MTRSAAPQGSMTRSVGRCERARGRRDHSGPPRPNTTPSSSRHGRPDPGLGCWTWPGQIGNGSVPMEPRSTPTLARRRQHRPAGPVPRLCHRAAHQPAAHDPGCWTPSRSPDSDSPRSTTCAAASSNSRPATRGRRDDPLFKTRRLLRRGHENQNDTAWDRLPAGAAVRRRRLPDPVGLDRRPRPATALPGESPRAGRVAALPLDGPPARFRHP